MEDTENCRTEIAELDVSRSGWRRFRQCFPLGDCGDIPRQRRYSGGAGGVRGVEDAPAGYGAEPHVQVSAEKRRAFNLSDNVSFGLPMKQAGTNATSLQSELTYIGILVSSIRGHPCQSVADNGPASAVVLPH